MSKTDLRRLPIAAQLRAVRTYANNRERSAHGSGGMQDPYVYPEHIGRKFRCVCPAGLWQMWANDEARRAVVREDRARSAILDQLVPGEWSAPTGSLARLNDMRADGILERRRNPDREDGPRYQWRLTEA